MIVLKRPDFDDLFEDGVYEYLANVKEDGTYRPGQTQVLVGTEMPSQERPPPLHFFCIFSVFDVDHNANM